MPQIRLLAPWTNADGEPFAAGQVIEASEEEATDLNNRGMASRLDDEKKLEEQQATSGVYDARLQRPDTPSPPPATKEPPAEEPPPKKR